jgi:hypothetical protein
VDEIGSLAKARVDYRDRALSPDIAVTWTRADMCEGRDPDIAAAPALL